MPDQKSLAPQSHTQAMPGPDGPEAPLTFEQVLAQEDAVLGGKQRSALCISGGGIRSATFALGALQGLAELAFWKILTIFPPFPAEATSGAGLRPGKSAGRG